MGARGPLARASLPSVVERSRQAAAQRAGQTLLCGNWCGLGRALRPQGESDRPPDEKCLRVSASHRAGEAEIGCELRIAGAPRRRFSGRPKAAIVVGRQQARHVVRCRAAGVCGGGAWGATWQSARRLSPGTSGSAAWTWQDRPRCRHCAARSWRPCRMAAGAANAPALSASGLGAAVVLLVAMGVVSLRWRRSAP